MATSASATGDKVRHVRCTHCGHDVGVAKRAMSVFCPHCKKRLLLENYKIKSYHASRLLATCGDVCVERSGVVAAPQLRVGSLTVRGRVQGDVAARGLVTVAKTGEMRGDIVAPRLVVATGARLEGFFRIIPDSDTA